MCQCVKNTSNNNDDDQYNNNDRRYHHIRHHDVSTTSTCQNVIKTVRGHSISTRPRPNLSAALFLHNLTMTTLNTSYRTVVTSTGHPTHPSQQLLGRPWTDSSCIVFIFYMFYYCLFVPSFIYHLFHQSAH
jgi:hypothetical protein